jgi:hypothetical protein
MTYITLAHSPYSFDYSLVSLTADDGSFAGYAVQVCVGSSDSGLDTMSRILTVTERLEWNGQRTHSFFSNPTLSFDEIERHYLPEARIHLAEAFRARRLRMR